MKKLIGIYTSPRAHWVGDGFPVRSLFSYHTSGAELSPFLLLDHAGPAEFAPAEKPRGRQTIRRSPRRPREVGVKPTRSRHCKRGAFLHSCHWAVTGLGRPQKRCDPRVRKPGHRGRPVFGA